MWRRKRRFVDDEDRDRVMKEFEPDTKPSHQMEAIMAETLPEVAAGATSVSLSITEDSGEGGDSSDFRLPGGQVEVVGGEVVTTSRTITTTTSSSATTEVEHGDAATLDFNADATESAAAEQRGEKEDSPIDLDNQSGTHRLHRL